MRRIALAALAAALLVPGSRERPRQRAPQRGARRRQRHARHPRPQRDGQRQDDQAAGPVPPGFIGVATQPPPGWTSKVQTSKLAKPVQTDDGPIDTQVSEVDWTAGAGAGIPAGQFANFPISVALPGRPGQTLTFKTVQTYSNGKVARWIGAPDSDQPAPTIDVTAKGGVLQDVAGGEAGPGPLPATATAGSKTATPVATRTVVEKQSANNTLAVIALIVGLLGLAAGATGLAVARRARGGERDRRLNELSGAAAADERSRPTRSADRPWCGSACRRCSRAHRPARPPRTACPLPDTSTTGCADRPTTAPQIALDDAGQRRPVAHHDIAVIQGVHQRGLIRSVPGRVVARPGQRRMRRERIEQRAVIRLTARLVVGQPIGERTIHTSRVDGDPGVGRPRAAAVTGGDDRRAAAWPSPNTTRQAGPIAKRDTARTKALRRVTRTHPMPARSPGLMGWPRTHDDARRRGFAAGVRRAGAPMVTVGAPSDIMLMVIAADTAEALTFVLQAGVGLCVR